MPLQIHTVVSEPFAENSYVVWRDGGGEAIVIDPGYEPEAIREVLEQSQPVELTPQNNYLRRLQHQLAERYGLTTESKGVEPHRRVVIYPV